MPFNTREVKLGFVDLGTDAYPEDKKVYQVISASSSKMAKLACPATALKTLDLDLTNFYCEHLPDVFGGNEALFKISINTRSHQDTNAKAEVAYASKFITKNKNWSQGFLYRQIFRNVVFQDFIRYDFQLFELDTDSVVYYNKIKGILDGVPEIKSLDILAGIPYLSLATKLFDGIIKAFGKNPDDRVWGEIPTLEITPVPGGAFLRQGIYVIFEAKNHLDKVIDFDNLEYCDGRIKAKASLQLSNTLVVNVRLKEFEKATK